MTISSLKKQFFDSLGAIYPSRELKAIFQLLVEELWELSRTDVLMDVEIDFESKKEVFEDTIQRLKKNEPIQYILGKASFYGRSFLVNEHTLIPRQETEELIELISRFQLPEDTKMLDIGTGTGIIPITCALTFGFKNIYAIDVSSDALSVSCLNAKNQNVNIGFLLLDVLSDQAGNQLGDRFDLITSNPPYVTDSERELMQENVLDYEPELALFVPDDDPLLFYKRIVELSQAKLKRKGILIVEINERFGMETSLLFQEHGFIGVHVVQDIHGKDRFVYGIKA